MGGQQRCVTKGFIEPRQQGRDQSTRQVRIETLFVMLRMQKLRNGARMANSSKLGSVNPMVKVFSASSRHEVRQSGDNRTGVKTAGEKYPSGTSLMSRRAPPCRAARDIPQSDAAGPNPAAIRPARSRIASSSAVVRLAAVDCISERVAAGQLARPPEDRVRRRKISVGEEFLQRAQIQAAVDASVQCKRRQFTRERRKSPCDGRRCNGFSPKRSRRKKQPPAKPVVNCEGKHAVEAAAGIFADSR